MKALISALLLALLLSVDAAAQTIVATVTPTYWHVELTTIPAVVEINVPASVNPRDFCSLLPPSAPLNDFSNWQYVSSAKNGVLTFKGTPGTFEARCFVLPGTVATNPAPGKLIDKKTVIVPVPKPRPVEIDNPNGKVVITRRQTDSASDVTIKIKEDQSLIEVLADKTDTVSVKQVKP